MVIANPPLAEPAIYPRGVIIKPPFEMGVANLKSGRRKRRGNATDLVYLPGWRIRRSVHMKNGFTDRFQKENLREVKSNRSIKRK